MQSHGLAIGSGHKQRRAYVTGGANGPEKVGGGVSLIALPARVSTALGPQSGQCPFLSYARFVLEPEFDGFSTGVFGQKSRYLGSDVFLKAAKTSGSFFGCRGRALKNPDDAATSPPSIHAAPRQNASQFRDCKLDCINAPL
jgi:hypothetical protein